MDRAKTTTLTGAEIVVRCLQAEGSSTSSAIPAALFIYDELFKQDKVKHVLVRRRGRGARGRRLFAQLEEIGVRW